MPRRRDDAPAPDPVRPRVVISECLEFEACRYNGARIPCDEVRLLQPHVEFRPVCPEVEVGLGVPRDPIRLVKNGETVRLVQPSTGRDLTDDMDRFSARFLGGLDDVDGFLLKSRSPSCGTAGVKLFADAEARGSVGKSAGRFAARVLDAFPWAAIEEEGRLLDYTLRQHFFTKLWSLARLRSVARMRDLVEFQNRHKLLLMAYDQDALRALGRLVANPDGVPVPELLPAYREGFGRALSEPPRVGPTVNVLDHAFGYVSDRLGDEERRLYLEEVERYRARRVPLGRVTALIWAWSVRFHVEYLRGQYFFHPFPEALLQVRDSGKGVRRR